MCLSNINNKIDTKEEPFLLKVDGLSHNFDYPLFKDINLSLNEKESIAIIGVSGSGKSTLLNIFSSLLKPKEGKVFFKNQDILNITKDEILNIRKNDFGIIFQTHYLFRGFTANENLQISELLNDISKIKPCQSLTLIKSLTF